MILKPAFVLNLFLLWVCMVGVEGTGNILRFYQKALVHNENMLLFKTSYLLDFIASKLIVDGWHVIRNAGLSLLPGSPRVEAVNFGKTA